MTATRYRWLIVSCALLWAVGAQAQQGFTGQVMYSGSPIAGVRVTLFDYNLTRFYEVRTGLDGRYIFSGVSSQPYVLGVAKRNFGYQQIIVDTNGGMQTRDFALQPETNQGQWNIIGNTAPENFDGTDIAVLLKDGRIFYCHDTIDPILFDPVTGLKTFPAGSGLPNGCMNGTLTTDGKVFFVGGQEGDDEDGFRLAVRYTRHYSPLTNTWQRLQDLLQPNGRWYPGFARLADGSYLVMGGGTRPNAERTNTCELWNPLMESWQWTGSMLNAVEFPPAALLYNGQVLITWSPPQLYSPATGMWRATGNFNQPNRGWPVHSDHSIVVLSNGKVLAIGIRGAAGGNSMMGELYDPNTETWSFTSNPNLIRFKTEVVQLPDGRVFVGAGDTEKNSTEQTSLGIVKWTDIYDPDTNAWRRMQDMNWFREYHALTLLVPDGRVVTTGGTRIKFRVGPTSADIEAFSPPYLFRGVRPSIQLSNMSRRYDRGQTVSAMVTPATQLTSLVLMGTESTTHWVSGGIPRRLVLTATQTGNNATFTLPTDANLLPTGNYMVFGMVDDIPSVGRVISVQ